MALPNYAAFLSWAGVAIAVYAGASVANRMGWVSADYRPKAAVLLLTGLLVQRAAAPKIGQSRVSQAAVAEAAAGCAPPPRDEASPYVSLPVIAVCIVCLAFLTACVALEVSRRGRMPPPPPQQQQSVPERRYADRRRA